MQKVRDHSQRRATHTYPSEMGKMTASKGPLSLTEQRDADIRDMGRGRLQVRRKKKPTQNPIRDSGQETIGTETEVEVCRELYKNGTNRCAAPEQP